MLCVPRALRHAGELVHFERAAHADEVVRREARRRFRIHALELRVERRTPPCLRRRPMSLADLRVGGRRGRETEEEGTHPQECGSSLFGADLFGSWPIPQSFANARDRGCRTAFDYFSAHRYAGHVSGHPLDERIDASPAIYDGTAVVPTRCAVEQKKQTSPSALPAVARFTFESSPSSSKTTKNGRCSRSAATAHLCPASCNAPGAKVLQFCAPWPATSRTCSPNSQLPQAFSNSAPSAQKALQPFLVKIVWFLHRAQCGSGLLGVRAWARDAALVGVKCFTGRDLSLIVAPHFGQQRSMEKLRLSNDRKRCRARCDLGRRWS